MIPTIGIRVQDHDGVPVVALEGEIDIANAPELQEQLYALLATRPPSLILDLTRVTYLDSRGVHVVLELAERMKIRHQGLGIVAPVSSVIKRILEITHVDAIVPLDSTVEDAAARMRTAGHGGGMKGELPAV